MTALRIESNQGGGSAVLDQTFRADYFRAELRSGALEAAVEFYDPGLRPPVSVFFAELATAWRGWEGERTWQSLEGDVALTATHDQLGTIALTVRLRSDTYASPGAYLWTAAATLFLDAGGLDALARQAVQLTN